MRTAVQIKVDLKPLIGSSEQAVRESILKTLAYFDIFHYPLTKEEIKQFADRPISNEILEQSLHWLANNHSIFLFSDFYSLQNNPLLAHRRKQGNTRAKKLLPKAIRNGLFLHKFPFVKSVAISGSLSKNFADDKSDFDFFIITTANRLWIARTLLHLFKKLTFLTGRQHAYCMNYFVDESRLPVEDKNIFTAIEIRTLLPVCGENAIADFFKANEWTSKFLPVCVARTTENPATKTSWLKGVFERLLTKRGEQLDNFLFKKTSQRWLKKQQSGKRNEKGEMMGLVTGKHCARSNPGAFQEKVLAIYQEKISALQY